jgi:SAM-dependent methyltransferase
MDAQPVPFVVTLLRALAGPGDRILDVGCGPALYRHVTDAEYVGLDVTDAPYADGLARDVDIVASAEQIPAGDASFDLAFSLSAFLYVPDHDRALHELRRVLRPGGRLLLFDYNHRMQRSLSAREGAPRPCWTQWGLRRRVRAAGFERAKLLVAASTQPSGPIRWARLLDEELRGQWAIVTALAPAAAQPDSGVVAAEQGPHVAGAARDQLARERPNEHRQPEIEHGPGEA